MRLAPVCIACSVLVATLASAQISVSEILERNQVEPEVLLLSSSLVAPSLNFSLPINERRGASYLVSPTAPAAALIALPPQEHKPFWDRKNLGLFAALSAARAMDVHSTWRFRARGSNEAQLSNAFVDNKALFVSFSAGMVGAQVLSSYVFHRTGHHKLERISALIDIGFVTGTAAWNYIAVQPPHYSRQ